MSPWAFINVNAGVWTFVIAVCFVLLLLFGFDWI
jgi:NADH:ubiquinone oxidoreductase subunit 3 (subunit A)